MENKKITIEINGTKINAEPGMMVMQAADEAGVYIPRFCYHRKLSIAANCRMCLVEVEKAPKPLPACATPVTAGMKVFTYSAKALAAQKNVMEFLLINHPLDCPICDQGGECELQDLAVGYGRDCSEFSEGKRAVADKNIGPLIATEMTRCIHCTRCVRFGSEIAGSKELGGINRGEHLQITTYIGTTVDSELSGNMIDLCPVGALTSKPYRFKARAWELKQSPSIAAHDCLGSNIYMHSLRGQVMRVVPKDNEDLNETWLSDRDRFSYEGLVSADRLAHPEIKIDGAWQMVTWEYALDELRARLARLIGQYGVDQLAALASPSSTVEELFLLQKFMRGMGSNNIDHRIHDADFSDQDCYGDFPGMHNFRVKDLENQEIALIIGSNLRKEHPLINHRLRKASRNGAQILRLNPLRFSCNMNLAADLCSADLLAAVAKIARAIAAAQKIQIPLNQAQMLAQFNIDPETQQIAQHLLLEGKNKVILLGSLVASHPQAAKLRGLVKFIADAVGAKLVILTTGANTAGAWLAGAVPHRGVAGLSVSQAGLNWKQAFAAKLRAYLLLNLEPELDCLDSQAALAALKAAELVIALTPYASEKMREYADIILPITPFSETGGSLVNIEGNWQTFAPVVAPYFDSKPAWKVLRVLGNIMEFEGFDYEALEQVRDEVREKINLIAQKAAPRWELPANLASEQVAADSLLRIAERRAYDVDNIVRRASSLQATADAQEALLRINSKLAQQLKLQAGEVVRLIQDGVALELSLTIDDQVADNTVALPVGNPATIGLGAGYAEIRIEKRV